MHRKGLFVILDGIMQNRTSTTSTQAIWNMYMEQIVFTSTASFCMK